MQYVGAGMFPFILVSSLMTHIDSTKSVIADMASDLLASWVWLMIASMKATVLLLCHTLWTAVYTSWVLSMVSPLTMRRKSGHVGSKGRTQKVICCKDHTSCSKSVMAQLACTPENCRDMHADPMMGSGGLPEGRLGGVGPRMEAGEPLEGRSSSNDEVSMSHGCSRQDSDYLACQPIPAWSMQCGRRVPAWKAAQQSLDTSVSMMIVQ